MEIRGRITQKLTPQSGTSAAGRAWQKQEFILETFDQFPRKVCMTLFGDKVTQFGPQFETAMATSQDVTVSIDIESRSFVGRDGVERWSTEVRPWKIVDSASLNNGMDYQQVPQAGYAPQYQPQPMPQAAPVQPAPAVPQFPVDQPAPAPQASGTDDLPF